MGKEKLTIQVDADAVEFAMQYANQHGTTISNMVEEFFRSLRRVNGIPLETPMLKELAVSPRGDESLEDYHSYLKDKFS